MRRVLLALIAFSLPVLAFAYSSPGSPSGYVNDFAHVVTPEAVQNLNAELTSFEQSTSNEITVVTVPSLGGDYIENYAVKLFAEWGIGKKDRDNGVLLLLAIQDRQLRIEVGYGLEGALPDSVANSIITNDITPKLKAGDYDGAVLAGVTSIMSATKGEYTAEPQQNSMSGQDWFGLFVFLPLITLQWLGAILGRSKSWWAGGVIGGLIGGGIWLFLPLALFSGGGLTLVLFLLGLGFDYFVSNAFERSRSLGIPPPWWTGGGGFGGGSGGGFGGFGGGGSGGGGASGRW